MCQGSAVGIVPRKPEQEHGWYQWRRQEGLVAGMALEPQKVTLGRCRTGMSGINKSQKPWHTLDPWIMRRRGWSYPRPPSSRKSTHNFCSPKTELHSLPPSHKGVQLSPTESRIFAFPTSDTQRLMENTVFDLRLFESGVVKPAIGNLQIQNPQIRRPDCISWKKSSCKQTCLVQTHVVQGLTVHFPSCWKHLLRVRDIRSPDLERNWSAKMQSW